LEAPPKEIKSLHSHKYIVLNGTFIQDRRGVFVVMDGTTNQAMASRASLNENILSLVSLFENLASQGLAPINATVGPSQMMK